jgi:Rrf2 family protein
MIKLSTKWDYALKAIIFLIKNNDKKVKIKEIAKKQDISESLLRRIVADLDKAGIITTYKWRNGGVMIEKPLKSISVFDILLAVWEELWVSDCSKWLECENVENCSSSPLYMELQRGLNGILKLYTLDKLKI